MIAKTLLHSPILLAALALAGCDSGTVPSPADRLNETAGSGTEFAADDAITLNGQGLIAGGEVFFFSADSISVRDSLADVLGPDAGLVTSSECGAGLIDTARYLGGLKVNFEGGIMVGWSIDRSADKEAERITVAGDVQVGSPRAIAKAAPAFSPLKNSTLGEEFTLGSKIGGFIHDDAVSMLYAGKQCFFR